MRNLTERGKVNTLHSTPFFPPPPCKTSSQGRTRTTLLAGVRISCC